MKKKLGRRKLRRKENSTVDNGTLDSTAVVQVKPDLDPAYIALVKQTQDLRAYAMAMQVDSPEGVKKATEDLSLISSVKRALEDCRKRYTTPLDEYKRTIQDTFKAVSTPLDEADANLRSKLKVYDKKQEAIKAEAARIDALRKAADDAAAKLAETTGEAVTPQPAPAPLPTAQPVEKVFTDVGNLNMRTVKKWKLVDFSKVPDKYKQLNETLISKVVKAGEPDIPGIEIYPEKEPVITTKR